MGNLPHNPDVPPRLDSLSSQKCHTPTCWTKSPLGRESITSTGTVFRPLETYCLCYIISIYLKVGFGDTENFDLELNSKFRSSFYKSVCMSCHCLPWKVVPPNIWLPQCTQKTTWTIKFCKKPRPAQGKTKVKFESKNIHFFALRFFSCRVLSLWRVFVAWVL